MNEPLWLFDRPEFVAYIQLCRGRLLFFGKRARQFQSTIDCCIALWNQLKGLLAKPDKSS